MHKSTGQLDWEEDFRNKLVLIILTPQFPFLLQIKEFMNESRILRRFNHLNVIKYYGTAVGWEPLRIVMELATNGALRDYLQSRRRTVWPKTMMCWGAAAGLAHIHSLNVIHCDIAARNCLFSGGRVSRPFALFSIILMMLSELTNL